MICFARTLPTPGIDCSRSKTRILPITSLCWPSVENLGDRGTRVLEPVLDLCALPARGGGLVERSLALLGSQLREGHDWETSISSGLRRRPVWGRLAQSSHRVWALQRES